MLTRVSGHALIQAIEDTEALHAVQEAIRTVLAAAPWPDALRIVVTEVLSEPRRILGGRLTPWALMPLCCCAAVSGQWRQALPAATAAELYSAALELLDDLEDGDPCATVQHHDYPVALNTTTALLALAHAALQPNGDAAGLPAQAYRRAQDALWAGLLVATGGQHLDLVTVGCAPLSIDECLDVARRKSGGPTEACCHMGAAFGSADSALIERVGELGRTLGLMAQLDNDLHDALDIHKSDRERRTQTVPLAFARNGTVSPELDDAALLGGVQMAYASMYAERARAEAMVQHVAERCPDPSGARAVLGLLLKPRAPAVPEENA